MRRFLVLLTLVGSLSVGVATADAARVAFGDDDAVRYVVGGEVTGTKNVTYRRVDDSDGDGRVLTEDGTSAQQFSATLSAPHRLTGPDLQFDSSSLPMAVRSSGFRGDLTSRVSGSDCVLTTFWEAAAGPSPGIAYFAGTTRGPERNIPDMRNIRWIDTRATIPVRIVEPTGSCRVFGRDGVSDQDFAVGFVYDEFGGAAPSFIRVWEPLKPLDAPRTVAPLGCPRFNVCDYRVSGSSAIDYSGPGTETGSTLTVTGRTTWTLVVRADKTPTQAGFPKTVTDLDGRPTDAPADDGPTAAELGCGIGSTVGGFSSGFAGLLRGASIKALGPIGLAVGIAGAACTATQLPGVDTPEATAATAACVGLTTFSTGMGAGALFLAPTGAGALIAGGISLVTGLVATIPCAFSDDGATAAAERASVRGGGGVRAAGRAAAAGDVPAATPVVVRLPRAPRGTPAAAVRALRDLATGAGRIVGHGRALGLCLTRADAARKAGDATALARLRACAASNARTLAQLHRRQASLHRALARAVRTVPDRLSRTRARGALRRLPAAWLAVARRAGLDRDEIADLRAASAQLAPRAVVPATVRAAAADPRVLRQLDRLARMYDGIARRFAAG